MTVASDVVVLIHRLEVDTLVFNFRAVLIQNGFNLVTEWTSSQVFPASQKSIILCDRGNACCWSLIDSLDRERRVDVFAEFCVAEETLWVISLVLLRESFELIASESEVHRREN